MELKPFVNAGEWAQIGNALKLLWLNLGLGLVGALSLLAAHAVVPSASDSGAFPAGVRKLRPALYLTGILAIIGVAVSVAVAAGLVDVVYDKFERVYR